MVKYANSKIYKIWSPSNPECIFYGSTTQHLKNKLASHYNKYIAYLNGNCRKYNTCYDVLQHDDHRIDLVESYSCGNIEELHAKEGEYIKNNNCVNKDIHEQQYKQDYTQETKEYKKILASKWNKEHKEQKNAINREHMRKKRLNEKIQKLLEKGDMDTLYALLAALE